MSTQSEKITALEGTIEQLQRDIEALEMQQHRTVPELHVTYEQGEAAMNALQNPFDPLPQEFVVHVDQFGERARAEGWPFPYRVF